MYSDTGSAKLPFHVSLGKIRPFSEADTAAYRDAVSYTAQYVSDNLFSQVCMNEHDSPLTSEHLVTMPSHTSLLTSGLDSSLLSEFFENNTVEHEHALPPTDTVTLKPDSLQFQDALFKALELDTPSYAHVPSPILAQFKELLRKYPHVFHLPNSPPSTIKGFYHNIDTGQAPPVYRLPYRKSPAELAAIKEELERMVKLKIIQPSHSPWGSPCILVRKPPEKGKPQPPRFVVDYRALNAITLGDRYPIPNVSNILDAISEGKIFAKLDLASGYWQVPVNPKHREKTAFCTHLGLWENIRMPFGLKTAPQTFQRILNTVFADFLYKWLIIYIDDCVTWSSSYEEALGHYQQIFERASKFGVQFKPTKCSFFSTNLQILGHRITPQGRFPTEKGTESISSFPRPHNVSSLKRFLVFFGNTSEICPKEPSIYVLYSAKRPRFRGHLNTRRNFKILSPPCFLRKSFCTTQIGMGSFRFTLMQAKQVVVQCLHSSTMEPLGLFVLLLRHLLPQNRVGLQHTKNFLLLNGL